MEHETFLSLLTDVAHWEFEIFLMVLFDGIIGMLLWPCAKKYILDNHRKDCHENLLDKQGVE